MRRLLTTAACVAALGLSALQVRALPASGSDFSDHWAVQLQRLQSWPAEPVAEADTIVFSSGPARSCLLRVHTLRTATAAPPVLYLLDRDEGEQFVPGTGHNWAALDARALAPLGAPSPNPEQQAFHRAVLTAVRAVDVLRGVSNASRAGLVGEGSGASLALAVAALRPEAVAFVCGHAPVNPSAWLSGRASRLEQAAVRKAAADFAPWQDEMKLAAGYVDLLNFAPLVQAPVLLTYGEIDSVAPPQTVEEIYDNIAAPKDLVEIPRGRHCLVPDLAAFEKVWQQWVGATREQ